VLAAKIGWADVFHGFSVSHITLNIVLGHPVLSRVLVTVDGVWIGEYIY
jgi:hypothetical protein